MAWQSVNILLAHNFDGCNDDIFVGYSIKPIALLVLMILFYF